MPVKTSTRNLALLSLLAAGLSFAACGGGGNTNNGTVNGPGAAEPSATAAPKTGFEADLEYVKKGQYTYVWVFSRKDGKPLDKTDAAYLRTNATQVVDWVTTEEGKKVIAGTNFDLALGNLELLKKRFVVENYSAK